VVVLEDRRIDAPEDLYATYIGSDFAEEGRKAAVEICKLLEGSEKKNVVNWSATSVLPRPRPWPGLPRKMGECGIEIVKTRPPTGTPLR
jgi:hypothetical protein